MKIIITFFFAAFFAGASLAQNQIENQPGQSQEGVQGWIRQNSGVTNDIVSIQFLNKDTGWAGSNYTTDGGNTWRTYQNGRFVFQFLDRLHGWAHSTKGRAWISATTDGGETWNDYAAGRDVDIVHFTTPNRGFLYGPQHVSKTYDGGKTWIADTTFMGSDRIRAFASYDSLTIIAVGSGLFDPVPREFAASIFLTTDGGDSWRYPCRQYFDKTAFDDIVFLDTNTIMVVGNYFGSTKAIFKSINLGYSFTASLLGDSEETPMTSITASNKNNISVAGGVGKIFRSTNSGATWARQYTGVPNDLYDITFADSINGWAVGTGGTILHTYNGGYSWVNPPATDSLHISTIPNPSNSTVSINYSLPLAQHVSIALYDIAGHVLLSPFTNKIQTEGQHTMPIDVHSIPSGTYILSIQTEQYRSVINCLITH